MRYLSHTWTQRERNTWCPKENDFFVVPRSDELLAAESSTKPELVELSAGDSWQHAMALVRQLSVTKTCSCFQVLYDREFHKDMVLWDSRLLHCNVPGIHPYDEMDLHTALEDAGLQDASPETCLLFSQNLHDFRV